MRTVVALIAMACALSAAHAQNYPSRVIRIVVPSVLLVHPSLPVRSVKELITFAKARPDELDDYIRAEMAKWGKIIREMGVTIQ